MNSSNETFTGVVKFFSELKGFGFIAGDTGQDFFVHKSGTIDLIRKDDRVQFQIVPGKKGEKAINVKRLN